jgi:hypothetical protein
MSSEPDSMLSLLNCAAPPNDRSGLSGVDARSGIFGAVDTFSSLQTILLDVGREDP